MKYEELRRLETNIEILESYCEHVCSSKTRTKEQLERVEKQISATGTRRMTIKCLMDSYSVSDNTHKNICTKLIGALRWL